MRLLAWLRSRRLAIQLLVGLTAYAFVTTLIPLESVDPAAVVRWDAEHPILASIVQPLGLHRAYSSPVFIAAALLLTVSTGLCAWQRTRVAWLEWRALGSISPGLARRIDSSPTFAIDVPIGSSAEKAIADSTAVLKSLRLSVRSGPRLVEASGNRIGLIGSPLFHWALVGLFVFAGLGQLTRHEGYVNVLVGERVVDAPASYETGLIAGPLAGAGFTGLQIGVEDVEVNLVRDDIPRGATPLVTLWDGETQIARQWVFPNSPLVYGPVVIHRADVGPAFVGSVSVADGRPAERVVLYYRVGETSERTFAFIDTSEATVTVSVAPVEGGRVAVRSGGGRPVTASEGEQVPISQGATLTIDSLGGFAQLKVVSDWSVNWIYSAFVLGTLGVALTVFAPPRVVRVRLMHAEQNAADEGDEALRLHVLVTTRSSDPGFAGIVEEAFATPASAGDRMDIGSEG